METPRFKVTDKLIANIGSLLCDATNKDGGCDDIRCRDCMLNKPEDIKTFLNLDDIESPLHPDCEEEDRGCMEYHRRKDEELS